MTPAPRPFDTPPTAASFLRNSGGATAVEFALIIPVLLLFLLGIICYGGYFWMAHDVQQLANDSARAAIAGVDAGERSKIAADTVRNNALTLDELAAARTKVAVAESATAFTVSVSYDASGSPFWALFDLLPMPSATIARSATVTLGGY